MKKFLALFLALVLAFGMVACGGNKEEQGQNNGDKVTLTIGIQPSAFVLDYDNNALTNWLEEQCDVELKFVEYAGGTDVDTQISTTIAAREELPDILMGINLSEQVRLRYGRDGYFVDLKDYFEDREGASKTFWDRLEYELSESDQKNVINAITDQETGGIYAVPTIETSLFDGMNYQVYINTEWLDAVNMDAPTSKEELLEVLRAFRDNDCNGNGIDDEIPIFGTTAANIGGGILDWIINMFVYYNRDAQYVVDENGKLTPVYITDEYREALKFLNGMYEEGLLTSSIFGSSTTEMRQIVTPASGTAIVGMFVGHPTAHITQGSEVFDAYQPLELWSPAVMRSTTCNPTNFISADCDNPDKAFELMMTMWSEEGSYRIRYGEKGVNWDDANEGAKSVIGMDARYMLIDDTPFSSQNTCLWGGVKCTLNAYAETESAEMAQEMDPWMATKMQKMAKCYELYSAAAEKYNPEVVCPKLWRTTTETEETEMERINLNRNTKDRDYFINGTKDIYSDTEWQEYIDFLYDNGLQKVVDQDQAIYDRQ